MSDDQEDIPDEADADLRQILEKIKENKESAATQQTILKLVHRLMLISVQSFLEFFISLCQVIYNWHVSDSVGGDGDDWG